MKSKILFSVILAVLFTVGLVSASFCCDKSYDSMSTSNTFVVNGYEYQDSLGVKVNFNKRVSSCDCVDFDSLDYTSVGVIGLNTLPVYNPSLVNQDMGCFGCAKIIVKQYMPKSKVIRCPVQ